MPTLTNTNIAALLQQFQPFFFFDPTEQFFPSVAEEVLNHQAAESWSAATTHQRGTAVLLTPLTATSYSAADVKAGVDDPSGTPLSFDSTAPTGIGQAFPYSSNSQDLFLDCAGWNDTAGEVTPGNTAYTSGSIEYLQQLFSGLGNAMNSSIQVTTPNPRPKFSIPRSTTPTIYAELDWAGRYPVIDQDRVAQNGGNADFPPSTSAGSRLPEPGTFTGLNNYLALTYYLFYPALETSPVAMTNFDSNRLREGQWEAITIFLKGDPDFGVTDAQGRPDFPFVLTGDSKDFSWGVRGLTPRFLVYSQGYSLNDDNFNPLAAEVRLWPADPNATALPVTVIAGSHAEAFVTGGTHRNLFAIDATVTPGTSNGPNPALNTTGAAVMGAAGSVAGICAGIAALPPAAIVCIIAAAIVFLIGLILFILSFLLESSGPSTETPQSTQPGSDVARDDGPAAIPNIPGTSITTNASATLPPTLRLISQYGLDTAPPITSYPLPSPPPAAGAVELPSWWSFPGRWGVRVTPTASGHWDSGSRRSDPFGRTRAYWNAYQLVQFIASSAGSFSL